MIDLGHLKITSDPEQERIVSTKVAQMFVIFVDYSILQKCQEQILLNFVGRVV